MRERGQFLGQSWVLADLHQEASPCIPVDAQGLRTPKGPHGAAEQRRNREMKRFKEDLPPPSS